MYAYTAKGNRAHVRMLIARRGWTKQINAEAMATFDQRVYRMWRNTDPVFTAELDALAGQLAAARLNSQ